MRQITHKMRQRVSNCLWICRNHL